MDGDKEAGQVTDKNGLITKTFEDNGIVIHLEEALSKIEGFGSQEQVIKLFSKCSINKD